MRQAESGVFYSTVDYEPSALKFHNMCSVHLDDRS